MNKCYFCESNATINQQDWVDFVNCPVCGKYRITDEAMDELNARFGDRASNDTKQKIANIKGWIIENPGTKIYQDDINFLLSIMTPTVAKRAEKLLRWLSNRIKAIGDSVIWEYHKSELMAITFSINTREVEYLLYEYLLHEKGFIKNYNDGTMRHISITPNGYAYLDDLNKNIDSQMGFCAMWFNSQTDAVWEKAIYPAILSAGYEPKRIDKHEHTEGVVDEIISLIRQSRFVIADLTGSRGGVYYEAGFAKGLGLTVIFTCNNQHFDERHFDVQHYNCLIWQDDQYDDFKMKLKNRIEAKIRQGSYRAVPL